MNKSTVTMRDLERANVRLQAGMQFYPSSEAVQAEIVLEVGKLVSSRTQLDWLIDTLVNRARKWPGTGEMRALFCTKYPPRDGNEPAEGCSIPGFTPGDGEAKSLERHEQLKAGGWITDDPDMRVLIQRTAGRRQMQ